MRKICKKSTRWGAFCLAIALLLPCVSCAKVREGSESAPNGQRLTVETVPLQYTAETTARVTQQAVDLMARFTLLYEGLLLNEAERQELAEAVQVTYLPTLAAIPVREHELDKLLALAERLHDTLEQGELTSRKQLLAMTEFYLDAAGVLDVRRTGVVGYRAMEFYLNAKIAQYEKFGDKFPWHAESAAFYRAQKELLTQDLGEEVFASAAGVAVFVGSLLAAMTSNGIEGWNEAIFSKGDLLLLLRRQSDVLTATKITPEQWSLLTGLFTPFFELFDSPLMRSELEALNETKYFEQLATLLPDMFELYSKCVATLSTEDLAQLQQTDAAGRAAVICRIVTRHETPLAALLERFSKLGQSHSTAEQNAIQGARQWEACEAFLAQHTACGSADVLAAIRRCGTEGSPAAADDLNRKIKGYFSGLAPYLTFVLTTEMA